MLARKIPNWTFCTKNQLTPVRTVAQHHSAPRRPLAFGHIGDGNVHFNVSQPPGADAEAFLAEWRPMNRLIHDLAHELGGSISAEHGVGQLKREEIRRYKGAVDCYA